MDVLGQALGEEMVLPASGTKLTRQINLSSYAKGVYTLRFESSHHVVFKQLLVR